MLRLTALLLVLGPLNAQSIADQEAARARLLLNSPNWTEKAWGVYFAGRLHRDDLRTPLVDQIHAAASLTAPREFVSELLDAAIESQIELTAPEIEPFQSGWPAAALILVARAPDADNALLRLADAKWFSLPWLAANNLLWQKKSVTWYQKLATELSVTHRFTIVDPGSGWGVGGSTMCGLIGCGPAVPPVKGFPPIARYTLGLKPVAGGVVVAAGPHTVYYTRTILPADKPIERESSAETLDVAAVREGYLAALADMPEKDVQARMHRQTTIVYRGVEDFRRVVEQSLREQEEQIREVFQAIDSHDLHTPPGLRLGTSVDVSDLRQTPSDPLPPIPPREILVTQ